MSKSRERLTVPAPWNCCQCRPSGDLRGKREGPRHSAPPAHRGSQPRPDAPEGKRPAAPPWPYKRARYAMTCGGTGQDAAAIPQRSEEHTSGTPVTKAHHVCRLLIEKK